MTDLLNVIEGQWQYTLVYTWEYAWEFRSPELWRHRPEAVGWILLVILPLDKGRSSNAVVLEQKKLRWSAKFCLEQIDPKFDKVKNCIQGNTVSESLPTQSSSTKILKLVEEGFRKIMKKRAMIPVESSSMRHLLLQLNPQWLILLGLQPLLFLRLQSQVILDPLVLLLSGGPSSAAFAALSLNHPWNWDKVVASWSNNSDPKAQITPSLLHHFAPLGSPTLTSLNPLWTNYPLTLTPFYPPWQPDSCIILPLWTNYPLSHTVLPPWQPNSYIILPPLNFNQGRGEIPEKSSHCSPLQPTLTCNFQSWVG